MEHMTWIWLAAIIFFGILEALTAGLLSIWFVAGSLVALIAATMGASLSVQMAVFILVSAIALAATRPLVKRYLNGSIIPTNADRVLGERARVTETIDNENATGAVYVDGKTWTARSTDGSVIPEGEQVQIETIEGVKLFVKILQKVEVER